MIKDKNQLLNTKGFMLALSSPSGGGKSTLARKLLADSELNFSLSLSCTTRNPRGEEKDGIHYNFLSKEEFISLRDNGGLLEWAEIHGNYYGTPLVNIEKNLSAGKNLLFDIDWQGVEQIKSILPNDIVSIFILPPNAKELISRLTQRGEDTAEVIKKRMETAKQEITKCGSYDYFVINDDVELAYNQIRDIIIAEQLRCTRQGNLTEFLDNFVAELNN